MSLAPWRGRPRDEAPLLAPSFLAACVAMASSGHEAEVKAPLHLSLVALALPAVLHGPTREKLPRDTRTSLPVWLRQHPELRVGLIERHARLRHFSREALLFAAHHGMVDVSAHGASSRPEIVSAIEKFRKTTTDEVSACLKRSAFIGRWFGATGSPATVLSMVGIRG